MSSEIIFMGGFLVLVAVMLAIDLGVINRKAHVVSVREALIWTAVWIGVAMLFYLFLLFHAELLHGAGALGGAAGHELTGEELTAYRHKVSLEYLTGYLIEKALSVDNIFVMIMIFLSFKVDPKYYHKILFWGILGAIVMRFAFIFLLGTLVERFAWILWIFGGILIYTGLKMLFEKGGLLNFSKAAEEEEEEDFRKNKVVKWLSRRLRMTRSDHDGKFFTRIRIKPRDSATYRNLLFVTPLFLVLLVIEGADVIFAVDSIPAIFSVTTDKYIVFFSNIFAILGLRSLFFVLGGVMGKFRYLKPGLAVLLSFIGVKMLLAGIFHIEISTVVSLLAIVGILGVSIGLSLAIPERQKQVS